MLCLEEGGGDGGVGDLRFWEDLTLHGGCRGVESMIVDDDMCFTDGWDDLQMESIQ